MIKTLVITVPFLESFRPPISGATICSIAESCGHKVKAWDANIKLYNSIGNTKFYDLQNQFTNLKVLEQNSISLVENFVASYDFSNFDYILISLFSSWSHNFNTILLKHLKKVNNKAIIVIGGPGVSNTFENNSSYGMTMLQNNLCDYYVDGEGEKTLLEIFKNNKNYPGINGIPPQQIMDLDSLPIPNYDYYNLEDYDYLLENEKDLFVYGSRGCVRNCSFCDVPTYWPTFRWRSGDNIAEELIKNWEKYGIRHFFFTDSLLNGNLKAFRLLHETLAKNNLPKFHIAGYAIIRPKNQHPKELFDMLQNTGTHFWSVGVEHGSDSVRNNMRKKFSNEDIDWHLEQSYRIGLQNNFLMMPTWVTETLDDHKEYLQIFPRWQKYVATGTISSMVLSPLLYAYRNTPLTSHEYNIDFIPNELEALREILWINRDNPELNLVERFRRTLAIWEQAVVYKYPLLMAENKIMRLNATIKKVLEIL
jgi:hypothetical protein